ncbi:MAG TPA: hypothetical protein VNM37_25570, partial [Candidatus Dormibacteraeota bacterium]|nr:hypothetical protein [Candidatus Dormibacteraeota bacterium]
QLLGRSGLHPATKFAPGEINFAGAYSCLKSLDRNFQFSFGEEFGIDVLNEIRRPIRRKE